MKPTIDLYQSQHQRALQCASDITLLSEPSEGGARKNAQPIRLSLAHLAGILKPHFSSEDRLVYPSLMSSENADASKIAKRFWEEMGGVSEAVNAFLDKWRAPEAIENEPSLFVDECSALFPVLKKRIDAEESELYPLFLEHTGHKP